MKIIFKFEIKMSRPRLPIFLKAYRLPAEKFPSNASAEPKVSFPFRRHPGKKWAAEPWKLGRQHLTCPNQQPVGKTRWISTVTASQHGTGGLTGCTNFTFELQLHTTTQLLLLLACREFGGKTIFLHLIWNSKHAFGLDYMHQFISESLEKWGQYGWPRG